MTVFLLGALAYGALVLLGSWLFPRTTWRA